MVMTKYTIDTPKGILSILMMIKLKKISQTATVLITKSMNKGTRC